MIVVIVETAHYFQVVCIGKAVLVSGINVHGLADIFLDGLRHEVVERTGILIRGRYTGVLGIGKDIAPVRVVVVIGTVRVIGPERKPFEGRKDEFRGVGQVSALLNVQIVRCVGPVTAVGHTVTQRIYTVKPCPVRVLKRETGRSMTVAESKGILNVSYAGIIVGSYKEVGIVADAGPRGNPGVDLGAQIVFLIHVGTDLYHTLLPVVLAGEVVLDILRAAAHADAVVGGRVYVIVQFMPPVGVGIVLILAVLDDDPGTFRVLGLIVDTAQEFHHVFLRVVHIIGTLALVPELVQGVHGPVTRGFPVGGGSGHFHTPAAAVTHPGALVRLAALGGDKNDTVSGAGTVNGCGGRILDDGDGCNILGIDAVEAALDAVDKDQRLTAVDGGVTTDVEGTGRTGITTGRGDVQARNRSLQHGGQIMGGTVFQLGTLHGSHGAGEIHFFLNAVTDHHCLFQHHVVLLEDYIHAALGRGDVYLSGYITQAGYLEGNLPVVHTDGEGTVHSGHCGIVGTGDHDDSAHHRCAARILDDARDNPVLGIQGPEGSQGQNQGNSNSFNLSHSLYWISVYKSLYQKL